jgi:acyl-coenzyme A thioesterase PaaI-like protein
MDQNRVGTWVQQLSQSLPESFRNTGFLLGFGLTQVPLIFLVSPRVVSLTSERVEIRIPLNRLTRNHLKSMYFGTLCIGADVAGGLLAARLIRESGAPVSLVFKDLKAEFLKRAEGGPVHFVCDDGQAIQDLVRRTLESGQRENLTVRVTASVPRVSSEPVARFELTLSLKRSERGKKFF